MADLSLAVEDRQVEPGIIGAKAGGPDDRVDLVVAALVFVIGLFGVLTRRNAISVLMGVELILNSANINYVAFSHFGSGNLDGQIYAIFVIMLAAAEAAVGLAIVLAIFQLFHTIDVEAAETLKE